MIIISSDEEEEEGDCALQGGMEGIAAVRAGDRIRTYHTGDNVWYTGNVLCVEPFSYDGALQFVLLLQIRRQATSQTASH